MEEQDQIMRDNSRLRAQAGDVKMDLTIGTDRKMRFVARLSYDGISQKDFFNLIINSYLDYHEGILELLSQYREEKRITSKIREDARRKERKRRKETIDEYALSDEEVNDIFDIIEQEHDL